MIVCRGPVFLGSSWAGSWYRYCSTGLRKNVTFDLVTKNSLFKLSNREGPKKDPQISVRRRNRTERGSGREGILYERKC